MPTQFAPCCKATVDSKENRHGNTAQPGAKAYAQARRMVIEAMKRAQQVSERAEAIPQIYQLDWVNAVVLNDAGQALVFESPRQTGSGVHWQVLAHFLPANTDPFTAVQTALVHKTGYQTNHWSYLGSHVIDSKQAEGNGYFFSAQQARQITTPQPNGHTPHVARWVSVTDLRYALLDGRIANISDALTVSLALLTLRQ